MHLELLEFLLLWGARIVEELAAAGVFFDELAEQADGDYDAFDLVCHIAFDQPPLTRRERVEAIQGFQIQLYQEAA